jgi:uncharacterized protein (TIGR02271 family)
MANGQINTMSLDQLEGCKVIGSDGDKIGTVSDIYFDKDTDQPEWALVSTGLFGTRSTFVPLTEASMRDGDLVVPFSKDQVKDAPNLDDDGELTQDEEALLARHYGMEYTEHRSDSGLPTGGGMTGETTTVDRSETDARGTVGRDTSGPTTDDAMTRSEEQLRIGKTRRPSQLARLRKRIESEHVTETVPVEREELRVEREPITDGNVGDALDGPELSEEEHEVTLTQEEVTVDKEVRPVERVRLDKDVVTEERQVDETVRKEQIDIDQDAERR